MNTKRTGDISELTVIRELVERGYDVSLPFGDNTRYDLIYDDGENLHRVQVKTGRLKEGTVRFRTSSSYGLSESSVHEPYTDDEIDEFMVYCPETGLVYMVPVEETGSSAMWIRVEDPQAPTGESHINWASEYVLQ